MGIPLRHMIGLTLTRQLCEQRGWSMGFETVNREPWAIFVDHEGKLKGRARLERFDHESLGNDCMELSEFNKILGIT